MGHLGRLDQTQIGHFDDALLIDHEVAGFDVAVDHSLVVGELQSPSRLKSEPDCGLDIQFPLFRDHIGQRPAIDELHTEEIDIAGRTKIVNLDDIVMRQLRGGIRLARKSRNEMRVLGVLRLNHLHGDVAVQRQLLGKIHRPPWRRVLVR